MDVPQAAIDAAKAKLIDRYGIPGDQIDMDWLDLDARAVLGAATPHIVAAARAEWEAQYPDLGVDLATASLPNRSTED